MFDLTTAAQWQGQAVGIVRVERELAWRGRRHLGDDLAFCLCDRARGAMLVIDDNTADDILAGSLRISFSPPHDAKTNQGAEDGKWTPLGDVPHHRARLDDSTLIISAGLDWRYKDLRALWALKQIYRFRYCAVVYDLIPVRFPQFVVPGYSEQLTEYFGELLWLADHVMCISETTRRDWFRFAQEAGAPPVSADVFSLGSDLPAATTPKPLPNVPKELQDKRFALYVSTIEPRKNHRMLYEAWDECVRTKRVDPARDCLVFVGRRGWATEDLMREIATNPLTRETIVILHDIPDEQLTALYCSCAFVVFPSLSEGFGLPLAEALGYGKLCVSSNASALAEIGGDLVMRLDPKDTLAWASTIARLFASESEVIEWEKRVGKYKPVSWDDAAYRFFQLVTRPASASTLGAGPLDPNAREPAAN